MKLAAAALIALSACTACSIAGPASSLPLGLGTPFSLRAGESAQTADQAWRVGFDSVAADSRCPKGEQCVWAGDATVRVWWQQGAGPRQMRELRLAPGPAQATRLQDLELRLLSLAPVAITGKAIGPADYAATLVLRRGAAADPER